MGIMDFLFGSKGKIDWKELQKMVELQAETNRTNRQGIFTGWEWDEDKQTQTQTIDPRFQGAVDRLGFNAGKPADPYKSPSQFSTMLDAKMANQMNRQGLDTSQYQQADRSFQPSAEREGRFAQAYLPPAPEEGPPQPPPGAGPGPRPPGRPPGGGMPPGGGPRPPGNMRPHIAPDGGYA